MPPGALIYRLKPFWIRRSMIEFRKQKSCIWCQWHRMHKDILLGSPFKFIYFFKGGVGQFANLYVFAKSSHSRLPGPFESFVGFACKIKFSNIFQKLTQHAYKKFRFSSRIRIYMQKGFSPLIRAQVENLVTLSLSGK
jgi:hypothetical protein